MVPRVDLDTTRAELVSAETDLAEAKLRYALAQADLMRATDEALKRRVAWSLLTAKVVDEGLEL